MKRRHRNNQSVSPHQVRHAFSDKAAPTSKDMPDPPALRSSGAAGHSTRAGDTLPVTCLCEHGYVRIPTSEVGRLTGSCGSGPCDQLALQYPALVSEHSEPIDHRAAYRRRIEEAEHTGPS